MSLSPKMDGIRLNTDSQNSDGTIMTFPIIMMAL